MPQRTGNYMIIRWRRAGLWKDRKESLYRHGGTDDDGKSAVPYRYHAVVILIEILCVLPFLCGKRPVLGRNGDILYLCRGSIGNGMDSACVYQPQTAYGLQSGYAEKPAGQLPDKNIPGSTSCHEQL